MTKISGFSGLCSTNINSDVLFYGLQKQPKLVNYVGSLSLRNCACREEYAGKSGDHSAVNNNGPHGYFAYFHIS
jgi:hypothetical protein